jgi:hypothetical protein
VLAAIGTLALQQAKPALTTLKGLTQLLNCAAAHLGTEAHFRASGAVLHVDSGASCLSPTLSMMMLTQFLAVFQRRSAGF